MFELLAVGHRELQQAWSKDSFIKSGGTAKSSKRRSENFSELFAACHAAEDRLKDLTLKHGRAVKTAPPKTRQQQENIVPTAKRRDALRYAHMQGNTGQVKHGNRVSVTCCLCLLKQYSPRSMHICTHELCQRCRMESHLLPCLCWGIYQHNDRYHLVSG